MPVPSGLEAAIQATNEQQPTAKPVTKHVIPIGASDALPFLVRGWQAVTLTCINPALGAPRHYHQVTDTWSNLDVMKLHASIDFAERLTRRLARSPKWAP
jgi:hypothetical protein